jgi:hypothetical protein
VRNLDPAESEVERLSVEEFRAAYHLPGPEGASARAQAAGAVQPLPGSERPDEIWVYVVWALLLVLGIEFLIAGRTHG